MIALKVEMIGGQAAAVLTPETLAALHLAVGDTLRLDSNGDGAFHPVARKPWTDDPHARGRAYLRRYNRSLGRI